uniref:Uncharacterized protein n=1 Tax=Timema poppense TaxID=170557 RepID=A0A7R9DJE0_TIMPO|nr:unnamed protein product [Timema poppensis]
MPNYDFGGQGVIPTGCGEEATSKPPIIFKLDSEMKILKLELRIPKVKDELVLDRKQAGQRTALSREDEALIVKLPQVQWMTRKLRVTMINYQLHQLQAMHLPSLHLLVQDQIQGLYQDPGRHLDQKQDQFHLLIQDKGQVQDQDLHLNQGKALDLGQDPNPFLDQILDQGKVLDLGQGLNQGQGKAHALDQDLNLVQDPHQGQDDLDQNLMQDQSMAQDLDLNQDQVHGQHQ